VAGTVRSRGDLPGITYRWLDDDELAEIRLLPAARRGAALDDDGERRSARRGQRLTRRPMIKESTRRKPKPHIDRIASQGEWERIVAAVAARSGGRCERCGERPPDDPHHRKFLSRGGEDCASNVAALCRRCHREVHAGGRDEQLTGYAVPSFMDHRKRPVRLYTGALALLLDDGTYSMLAAA
jgi:5-methylcytosine-specific restriction endonuclease McrA